ncbi:MAG: hypothetical protein JJ992_21695, partial [Planctomycetes bacterium]|nr:hypothetical protein [Planctomycetota bacterium]
MGKGIGYFPETDGGGHDRNKVDGVQVADREHVPVRIPPGNLHHDEYRQGIDQDQQDQRRPHAPHREPY